MSPVQGSENSVKLLLAHPLKDWMFRLWSDMPWSYTAHTPLHKDSSDVATKEYNLVSKDHHLPSYSLGRCLAYRRQGSNLTLLEVQWDRESHMDPTERSTLLKCRCFLPVLLAFNLTRARISKLWQIQTSHKIVHSNDSLPANMS